MKVLFFIDGPAPTAEDRELAAAIGTEMFRNAALVGPHVERCDAVAGAVPPAYAKFPRADLPPVESTEDDEPETPDASGDEEAPETSEPAPASEPAEPTSPRPRGRRKQ